MPPSPHARPLSMERGRIRCEALQPHRVFLGLVLTLGVVVMVANPPFQAPDEGDHFYRAFQLSEGTIVGQKGAGNAGGSLPVIAFRVADSEGISHHADVKMTPAIWRKKAEPAFVDWKTAERVFCGFPHTVIYPPVSYLPQTVAIFLGRLAHVGPLGLMYLARLAGFAAAAALGFLALRCLPVYRWSALMLLVSPMSHYLFGSVASDGVLITGAFLLLALVVRLAIEPGRAITRRELALILVLAAGLSVAKVVYLPLGLVALLFVLPRLQGVGEKIVFGAAMTVGCLVPVWLWGRVMVSLYVPGRTDIPIDPAAQWLAVTADPVAFGWLVVKSIASEAEGIYQWFVGVLGWGDTPLPEWFYYVFGWGLFACVVAESGGAGRLRWSHRAILLGAFATGVVLIFGAQYATWNSPGSRDPIEGIEGRYFLPLAPLAVLSFPALGNFQAPRWCPPLIGTAVGTVGAVVCLAAVVGRFYFE